MFPDGFVSTLAEQMLEARARAIDARASGKDARSIEAIDRSLRQTLARYAQLRDPREVAMQGFSLRVKAPGEILVRHGERVLPVSSACLQSLFGEAGVTLLAGQVLLLDDGIVTILIEEALGALSREEARIRDAKSRLIRASLEVDPRERGDRPPAERRPREAA